MFAFYSIHKLIPVTKTTSPNKPILKLVPYYVQVKLFKFGFVCRLK